MKTETNPPAPRACPSLPWALLCGTSNAHCSSFPRPGALISYICKLLYAFKDLSLTREGGTKETAAGVTTISFFQNLGGLC